MKRRLPASLCLNNTAPVTRAPSKAALLLLATIAGVNIAHAAALTWDGNATTSGAQDGSGTWTTGAGNWLNTTSSTDNVSFAASDTPTFGAGVAGTYAITVGGNVTSGAITFNTSGYTLSSTAAQIITNNTITVTSGASASIGANLTIRPQDGTSAMTLKGPGTLNINSGATVKDFGGNNVLLNAGANVNVLAGGLLTASSQFVVGDANGGAQLNVSGGSATLTNTGTGNIVIANNASGTNTSGIKITGGNLTNSSPTGGLRFGSNTVGSTGTSATFDLDGGTVTVSKLYSGIGGNITSTVNLNGGTLKVLSGTTFAPTFMTGLTSANVKEGGALIDTNGVAVTIGQALLHGGVAAIDGGLTKNGAGTLTVTGANAYTGATTVNTGNLTVGSGGTLGASTAALNVNNPNTGAGTAVVLNLATDVDTTTGSLSGTIAAPSSGTNIATINNGGTGRNFTVNQTTNATFAGIISGAGSFTLGGSSNSSLTLTGANNYTGGTNVNAGRLVSPRATAGGATALASGATLEYAISSSTTQGASAYTGAGTIQKTGAGTLTLGTTASSVALSAGGSIDVQGGTFKADDGSQNTSFASNLGDIKIASGAIFDGSNALVKADKLTGNGTFQAGYFGARSITVGVNNGSSTFAGTLQGNGVGGANGSTPLIKTGNGTFTLTGSVNINNNTSDTNAGDDVLRVTGGTSGTPSTLTLSPTGPSVIGSTSTKNIIRIAPAQSDVAILNQTAGTINSTSISIGNTGVGTYNFSGGTTNANKVELAFTGPFGSTGDAALNVSGTAALNVLNNGSIVMGTFYARKATVVQTGGTVALYSDAGTTLGGNGSLAFNGGGTASSYTLSGGTLSIPAITLLASGGGAGGGTGTMNLDGGTLSITKASFSVPSGVTFNVKGDGAIANSGANIDTNGLAITFNAPLLHSGPNAIDGGLTKLGAGTLTLGGNNTYTGPTTINNGTLQLDGSLTSSAIILNSGTFKVGAAGSIGSATISINGGSFDATALVGGFTVGSGQTIKGTGTYDGDVTVAAGGTLAPGNSPGVTTFSGDLTLSGTTIMEINGTTRGTQYDGINLTGGANALVYGGTLSMSFNTVPAATVYDLFQIAGTVSQSGTFGTVTISGSSVASSTAASITGSGWTATFTDNITSAIWNLSFDNASGDLTITPIPEPSTFAALAGFATLGLAACRRRRTQKLAA